MMAVTFQDRNHLAETVAMSQSQVSAVAIEKAYRKGEHKIPVLRGVEIAVAKGEFLSIVGQSGSGKSTLFTSDTRFYRWLWG